MKHNTIEIIVGKALHKGEDKPTRAPDPMQSSDFEQNVDGGVELETHAEKLIESVKRSDAAGVVEALRSLVEALECSPEEESDEGE